MKTVLILIITLLTYGVKAQDQPKQIAYCTTNKDTLYVPNNEAGRAIDMLWSTNPLPDTKPPVIIYMDSYRIDEMIRLNSTTRPGVRTIMVSVQDFN